MLSTSSKVSSARSVERAARRAADEALKGFTEPRLFTPPLRELTPETSLGFACTLFATKVLGITLVPWEEWLLVHLLELREDGNLRFRTAIVLVARQNGKSTLSIILALFFLYGLGTKLIIGTAQDLDVAESLWNEAVEMVDEIPELKRLSRKPVKTNGKKALVRKTGEAYKVKAANRRAGRGLSGNLVMLDELREHQSWDAWAAVTKTTMARAFALILCLSNAGDPTSIVLAYLRKMAHLALGDPDGINADEDPSLLLPDEDELDQMNDAHGYDEDAIDAEDFEVDDETLGIFEWSATPGKSKWDREGWQQANPSMGYTELTGLTIRAAAKTDPEWIFRTEVLCQWSATAHDGIFPPGAWEAGKDPESHRRDGAPVYACIDVAFDRSRTRIAICAERDGGGDHVEIVANRAGTGWVKDWIMAKKSRRRWKFTGQAKGTPSATVIAELTALVDEWGEPILDVTPWQGDELQRGHGTFYDAVTATNDKNKPRPTVFHRPSPILDVAAGTAATKNLGDGGWVVDRKASPIDVSGLVACIGAHWLKGQPHEEDAVSAYETHRLEVL